jgi:hypothetical protein
MGRTGRTCGGALRTWSIRYCAEPSPATYQSSSRPNFDLVINLTTAKALGLTIPDKLLALANAVIE